MADLVFSIGANDAEFQRTLDRLDKNAARTASSVERSLSFNQLATAGKKVYRLGMEMIDAYAASSEVAAERVRGLTAEVNNLAAAMGETLVDGIEAVQAGLDGMGKDAATKDYGGWFDSITSGFMYGMQGPLQGIRDMGMLSDGSDRRMAADAARQKRLQEKKLKEIRDFAAMRSNLLDQRDRITGSEGGFTAAYDERSENNRNTENIRSIGGMSIEQAKKEELLAIEEQRHQARMRQIDAERVARMQSLEEESRKEISASDRKREDYMLALDMMDAETRTQNIDKATSRAAEIDRIHLEYRQKSLALARDENLTEAEKARFADRLAAMERSAVAGQLARNALSDRNAQRFTSLGLENVSDATTRKQVLGFDAYRVDPAKAATVEQTKAVKKTAENSEAQVKLLRSIDAGISRAGGNVAVFQ